MAEVHDPVATAAALLHRPALVVLAGPPGCGRTTLLRQVTAAVAGPVHAGGGLAMLQAVPALALSRAVRARLPAHDVHLLAEAVRSRVRGGLLVLDDLQYADAATLQALPLLAAHCRVLVAVRTPHRLPADTLRAAATAWLPVPPLSPAQSWELGRRHASGLDDATLAAVLDRAGGNPLAITALVRQAAAGRAPAGQGIDQVAYAIAAALADLPRPARTALAALGLLGRPAPAALLGTGAMDLHAAGLITSTPAGELLPTSTYVAETAAGLLDAAGRVELHTRLAELTPAAEAARHLAAAGDAAGAHRQALLAADRATGGDRAALLLFACELNVPVSARVRVAAADALLAAGRPAAAARVLTVPDLPDPAHSAGPLGSANPSGPAGSPGSADPSSSAGPFSADPLGSAGQSGSAGSGGSDGTLGVEADVLRGEALLQAGHPGAARAAVAGVPDAAPGPVLAGRDRVLLLAELATDPAAAHDLAGKISARYPSPPPGVAAALAAVQAHYHTPGWDVALAEVAESATDPQIARWSGWLLVEHLVADGRLPEAAAAALRAAAACAADLAYGWQTRFAAAADWALALHGTAMPPAGGADPAALPAPTTVAGAMGQMPGGGLTAPGESSAIDPGGPATAAGRAAGGSAADSGPGARPPLLWPSTVGTPLAGNAGVPGGSAALVTAGHPAGSGVNDGPPTQRGVSAWDGPEGVLKRSGNLADRAIPDEARGYATAATALIEADTGLLAAARAHLDAGPDHPATGWVARETAWLDGQPARAAEPGAPPPAGLIAGLHAITARWAAHDLGASGTPPIPADLPAAARRTLTAWATGTGFAAAAEGWGAVALREQVRCLLAAGLTDTDPQRAVAALLDAERLADAAGLTVLAGRARRGLRRHHVHRDTRSPRSGDQLTRRETDVLRLVAAGEPTRRIAGQLGISAETVDTHIRAGMRKLGARTRTEAAALAFTAISDTSDPHKDGR